jgi:hypothetical protein
LTLAERLRWVLADPANPDSAAGRARRRRWHYFSEVFPNVGRLRVIDLGGTVDSWRQSSCRPAHLTILNIDANNATTNLDGVTPVTIVRGDACEVPEHIRAQRFDLVYSNSVIEHVGNHERRCVFARSVHSLAPHYWVQTPYRYFPVEPHFIFPAAQFLPVAGRAWIARHWPVGHRRTTDVQASVTAAKEIELLGVAQLLSYFPDADVLFERFVGLIKSLVAVRCPARLEVPERNRARSFRGSLPCDRSEPLR